jgi:hypothetical protein
MNRSFDEVATKIIHVIEHDALAEACDLVASSPRFVPVVRDELIEILCATWEPRFTDEERIDFIDGLNRISMSILYMAPESYHIVWEKLAKLCQNYLTKYAQTSWTLQISRIIRGN